MTEKTFFRACNAALVAVVGFATLAGAYALSTGAALVRNMDAVFMSVGPTIR